MPGDAWNTLLWPSTPLEPWFDRTGRRDEMMFVN
jgi:hypothetical protein